MKKKHFLFLALIFSIFIFFVYNFLNKNFQNLDIEKNTSKSLRALESLIKIEHPIKQKFSIQIKWVGKVEPQTSIKLATLLEGKIIRIDAEDQNFIKKGQSIFQLGGPQIKNMKHKMKAQIGLLKKQIKLKEKIISNLEESLKTHLVTINEVFDAKKEKLKMEEKLNNIQSNLKILEKESHIVAPISGIFTNRKVCIGQNVTYGQVIGEIIDTNKLRINALLFPPHGIQLKNKQAIIFLNEHKYIIGLVKKVLPNASSTGAINIWIEGSEINFHFHPGQTISGIIETQSKQKVIAIPKSAILYDTGENPFIYIYKNNSYKKLKIKTGMENKKYIAIVSKLKEDQLVVVKGAYELFYQNFNKQFKVQD